MNDTDMRGADAVESRKKVGLVVTSLLIVTFFLTPLIAALSRKYDLTLLVKVDDEEFLKSLNLPIAVIPVSIERNVAPWRDIKALWHLLRELRAHRFDVVHSISPKGGLLGMMAAWATGVPVRIHTFQGEVWATRQGLWRSALRFMDKIVARLATQLTVVGHSERQFLIGEGVIPPQKAVVLANGSICGVDTDRFLPNLDARESVRREIGVPENAVLLLFMGRINRDKGVLDLAESFASIAARRPEVVLLLVGPEEEAILEHIRTTCASYSDRLKTVGYTRHPERYMAAADILCLPSYREGFPVTIIEAAACAVPAVASRIYGVTDAVEEGVTGFLHAPRSPRDLADKLLQLLQDESLRQKMGIAGRERVLRLFTQARVTNAMTDLYCELLETHPS